MAGHMGDKLRTMQNIEIIKTDLENELLYLKGSIPGAKNSEIMVKQSIKNLVLTNKMERPFQPGIGCDVRKMLFENFTVATVAKTKEMIVEVLEYHEPRCNLINVETTSDEDNNALYITIVFSVINSSNIETVDLVLERVR